MSILLDILRAFGIVWCVGLILLSIFIKQLGTKDWDDEAEEWKVLEPSTQTRWLVGVWAFVFLLLLLK